jgi:NADH-quinone oxidoreductase subunit L
MINLTVWVLVLPLLGFILLGLFGKAMPRPAVLTIAWGASFLAFLFAAIGFLSMLHTPAASRVNDAVLYTWMSSGAVGTGVLSNNAVLTLNFGLLLDPLSATMLMVVTGVGFLIHVYSAGYMEDDPGFGRFFAYMNFFIFAMVLLVSADNFLFLLVGWALVGLASFLLIGFWFTRSSAVAAAQKALVINIIGDFGLMLAIFLIFQNYHTLNYLNGGSGVLDNPITRGLPVGITTAICLLLFVGCAAKSAQLPLYMWLPDAMEGPTPVSALIHAATMVTAGVYLVARANPLFQVSPAALITVAVIGCATALFAATIALTQLDIKRILAYSTISQLGYMFMAEGAQNYSAGVFHLTTHAYFKALLFLGAGSVIHALGGEQDMRQMGGLRGRLKITCWTFLIAALAISGIFPLSGFWSKDEIIGSLLARATSGGGTLFYVLWALALITAGLTAFYMFRLTFGIFFGSYRGSGPLSHGHDEAEDVGERPHPAGHGGLYAIFESPPVMTVPLIILAVLSVIGGFVGSYALFGQPAANPLGNFLSPLFTVPTWTSMPVHEFTLSWGLTGLSAGISLALALLGILVAWLRYGKGFEYKESRNPIYQLLLHKYYIDELCIAVIINPLKWLGRTATSLLEGNLLDGGSRGVAWVTRGIGGGLRRVQTGYVRNYALAILFGVVLLIIYYAVVRG